MEPLGNLRVGRVDLQRDVGGEHHRRMRLGGIVGVGHGAFGRRILGRPLPGAGRALRQLPFVSEQIVEVVV